MKFDASECTDSDVESLLTKVSQSDWFDDEEDFTDKRVTSILDDFLFPLGA